MARGKKKAFAANAKALLSKPTKTTDDCSTPDEIQLHRLGITVDLLQRCLNLFRNALSPSGQDHQVLQEVKGHLYDRNFEAAFGQADYLRVYASRWSPSRALAYLEIFASISHHLNKSSSGADEGNLHASRIVCLGGGAGAEAIGLAGWASLERVRTLGASLSICADLVDIADWAKVAGDLSLGVITPPRLSQYASAAAKEANSALLSQEYYAVRFHRMDVLGNSDASNLANLMAAADLVTLMFTLNELYSLSILKTQALLANLTTSVRPGAHLLIVDSPGSYSTVSTNSSERKYPMKWLVDHTLLGPSSQDATSSTLPKWQKIMFDDSRWFRLPRGLQYPIDLEDMRYQIHLYRREVDGVAPSEES